jgi:hypothetical protein
MNFSLYYNRAFTKVIDHGYHFVDLVELILKICLITIAHSDRKIS